MALPITIGSGINIGGGISIGADPASATIVASGLQLYLDAANATSYSGSGTTWFDLTSNSNNLTMQNAGNISYTSSGGGYFTLTSTGYFYSASTTGTPTGNTNYALCAWINVPSVQSYNGIMDIGSSFTNYNVNGLTLQSPNKVSNFWFAYDASGTTTIPTNTWFNVVAQYDGTSRTIYVNGTSLGTLTLAGTPGTHNVSNSAVYVGAAWPANSEYLQGSIGQALIYNRNLTPTEITQNYTAVRSRYGV
jgi:hypothetical protein